MNYNYNYSYNSIEELDQKLKDLFKTNYSPSLVPNYMHTFVEEAVKNNDKETILFLVNRPSDVLLNDYCNSNFYRGVILRSSINSIIIEGNYDLLIFAVSLDTDNVIRFRMTDLRISLMFKKCKMVDFILNSDKLNLDCKLIKEVNSILWLLNQTDDQDKYKNKILNILKNKNKEMYDEITSQV